MESEKFYTLLAPTPHTDGDTLSELQAMAARYPWFPLPHLLLYETMLRHNAPDAGQYAVTAGVYAADRNHFYWRLQQPVTVVDPPESECVIEFIDDTPDSPEPLPPGPTTKHPVAAPGGDYFSAGDEVDLTGNDPITQFIIEQPKINPHTSPLDSIEWEDATEKRQTPIDYVTETLAQIYAEQQLADLAIGTYEKLILQIPKKSAYFAAQIKEFKKHK
ncbi:MAG: hypothetical protein LBS12_00555 [Prevotellaceae bacterium]|jgi:hypothetical protein|nr:hypothetical protein [Prevotellaceae bacterium]